MRKKTVGAILATGTCAAILVAAGAARAGDHDHDHAHGHDHASHGGAGDHGGHGGHDHSHDEKHAHGDDATVHHRFEDAEQWAARFEDPARDAWQFPDRVVEALVDRPDLVVADIGSATGYFPVRFARAAPQGMIFGADLEPDMVRWLNDRAAREGLANLVSVLAGTESPHLPRAVDVAFLCNTYHHIEGRVAYFERLKSSLRPEGRVAVVDFRLESERGPNHKLAPEVVEKEMLAAGYRVAARHDFLPDQYFLVFEVETD